MTKENNKNLDIIRAFALLLVLIYHATVIFNFSFPTKIGFINDFVKYFGEIGVTLFFIISGYCIYYSIERNISKNGEFNFNEFITKRFKRIFPEYAFSIIIMILLTSQVVLIANDLTQLITHFFFFHNFFPETHGAINGVLWTMGVIFQFYIVSFILYKFVNRFPKLSVLFSILITISSKIVVYKFIVPVGSNAAIYLVYGRQLISSLDNFVIGMIIAYFFKKEKNIKQRNPFLFFIIGTILSIIYIYMFHNINIYLDNIYGYFFHTGLAIVLGLFIYTFMKLKLNFQKSIYSPALFLAKYEYGIYIWHLLIMINFANNSVWFNSLSIYYKFFLSFSLSIIVGIASTEIIGNCQYQKIFEKIKIGKAKKTELIMILFIILILPKLFNSIIKINHNIKSISTKQIVRNDTLQSVVDEIEIVVKKDHYTYLYIDNLKEEGYFNYYRIRYYLSPNSPLRYNDYIEKFYLSNEIEIIKYLNSIDVDYIIVKDWNYLFNKLKKTNDKNILVYKLNPDKTETIEKKLIPMNGGYLK